MFPLVLFGPVGPGLENDPDDVRAMATSLSSLGYGGAEAAAQSGEWTPSLENDVREFQRARGLTIDGFARPRGETEQSLNESCAWQPCSRHHRPISDARASNRYGQ